MAERWTRQRRLEHTRSVLLDAAEEVFAKQGFAGAALEDIAEAAGYTRGAIYSHFGAKEELFLAVIERHLQRFLSSFEDVLAEFDSLDSIDVARFAERWRELTIAAPSSAALGYEFSLFLLRNPDARARVAAQRTETVTSLTDYIETHIAKLGGTLRMPAETLARILIASHEGIAISGYLDDRDLYQPFLEMVLANVIPKPLAAKRSRRRTG
ncbi:TetR/AcrR family transcriptional regulator [Mycolicibacterium iranicum]|uniref:TetR family transcriptional regulator n=1 Tax=Mycolicibacterium iranicum TaxID=912594 RepID=A0A1X1X2T1_MYCIR|nr:TetR/AcrR family transcriptional regulator [Mycolicibacterium iranicum]ORV93184.1 TetR family transcriptional regulator [Mycolicibacterium iranicum]